MRAFSAGQRRCVGALAPAQRNVAAHNQRRDVLLAGAHRLWKLPRHHVCMCRLTFGQSAGQCCTHASKSALCCHLKSTLTCFRQLLGLLTQLPVQAVLQCTQAPAGSTVARTRACGLGRSPAHNPTYNNIASLFAGTAALTGAQLAQGSAANAGQIIDLGIDQLSTFERSDQRAEVLTRAQNEVLQVLSKADSPKCLRCGAFRRSSDCM